MKKEILKVKKEFYPDNYLTIDDAKKSVKNYLIRLIDHHFLPNSYFFLENSLLFFLYIVEL